MRPVPGADIEYARATLVGLQEEISKARSVLVIGAGPVGIEVAGVSPHRRQS
jgi:NADPH-dependent 2,4-dienoyl-CoA reductase/sulfur reductase-like enzyme